MKNIVVTNPKPTYLPPIYEEEDSYDFRGDLKFYHKVMKLSGVGFLVDAEEKSSLRKILAYIYMVVMFLSQLQTCFFMSSTFVIQVINRKTTPISNILIQLIFSMISTIAFIQYIQLLMKVDKIAVLIDQLGRFPSKSNFKRPVRLEDTFRLLWKQFIVWNVSTLGVAEFYFLLSVFDRVRNGVWHLPFPENIYPWGHDTTWGFLLSYFIQTLNLQVVVMNYSGMVALFLASILTVCKQFDILNRNLKDLFYIAISTSHSFEVTVADRMESHFDEKFIANVKTGNLDFLRDMIVEERRVFRALQAQGVVERLFLESIQHHQHILSACQSIQDVFTAVAFGKVFFALAFMCFASFLMTVVSDLKVLVVVWQLVALSLTEFFGFCCLGTFLMYKSSTVRNALYTFSWYNANPAFRRSMLLMQIQSARPVTLTAGKFYNLTLLTFVEILRKSFSFYTFVSQLAEHE